MPNKVRKAVVPIAGFGTRMLPIAKSVSKVMLPVVDKPIIQLAVEELVEAGIEDIIVVTYPHNTDVINYFGEVDTALREHLTSKGPAKEKLLRELEGISHMANIAFIEQNGRYGTGTPVLNAEPYLGGEPFIYIFTDDFFVGGRNSYLQMLDEYEKYGAMVMSCQTRTNPEDYLRYGYAGGVELSPGVVDVKQIVEHPGIENKPGDLASFGGFVVTPDVFPYLRKVLADLPADKELFFNAALNLMLADGKRIIAKEIRDSQFCDTGNKLEYMKTVTYMAARHPEIGQQYREFLRQFTKKE